MTDSALTVDRQNFYGIGPPSEEQLARTLTSAEVLQRWIDDRLAEAPPITPDQAATLADLLVGARN